MSTPKPWSELATRIAPERRAELDAEVEALLPNYEAKIRQVGKYWIIEFPNAPGCQTFGTSEADAIAQGWEALEGWLEAHLLDGVVPEAGEGVRNEGVITVTERLPDGSWARASEELGRWPSCIEAIEHAKASIAANRELLERLAKAEAEETSETKRGAR